MWVKICANTNFEDALGAYAAGADAVGFVFAPSKRQVTPQQVGRITAELPVGVERVGVFGAASAEEIAQAAQVAGLNAVQLHGGYVPQLTEALRSLLPDDVSIIQTVHWTVGEDAAAFDVASTLGLLAAVDPNARVLIDARVGKLPSGGTGVSFDWERARGVFQAYSSLRLILAGGLRPENVSEAVRTLRPWGVDVASGVELEVGKKDLDRVRRFIRGSTDV